MAIDIFRHPKFADKNNFPALHILRGVQFLAEHFNALEHPQTIIGLAGFQSPIVSGPRSHIHFDLWQTGTDDRRDPAEVPAPRRNKSRRPQAEFLGNGPGQTGADREEIKPGPPCSNS